MQKSVSKKIVIGYNIIRFVYCWRNILGSDNNRNIGLSEIIRMLENNVTFTQAADSVLECITDSMDVCDAVVMQIDRESDTMHVISETGNCFIKALTGTVFNFFISSGVIIQSFLGVFQ